MGELRSHVGSRDSRSSKFNKRTSSANITHEKATDIVAYCKGERTQSAAKLRNVRVRRMDGDYRVVGPKTPDVGSLLVRGGKVMNKIHVYPSFRNQDDLTCSILRSPTLKNTSNITGNTNSSTVAPTTINFAAVMSGHPTTCAAWTRLQPPTKTQTAMTRKRVLYFEGLVMTSAM